MQFVALSRKGIPVLIVPPARQNHNDTLGRNEQAELLPLGLGLRQGYSTVPRTVELYRTVL